MDLIPKPSEADCCNSGCNPCILDVYEEKLRKLKDGILKDKKNSKINCISETTYTIFKLIEIIEHTEDSALFTFQYVKGCSNYSTEQLALLYKPGQHFLVKSCMKQSKNDYFTRAYTPIPFKDDNPLNFTIIARLYEDGLMSKFLKRLKIGSETLWRGPYGSFEINYSLRYVLLIAQGTGIAPLFAVIQDYLNNLDCESFLKLFFCCRTEQDILLRNELYEFSSFWNFSYEIFLSNPGIVQCKYNENINLNRLKGEDIENYVKDKLNDNIQVLICGSEIFNQDMLQNVVVCGVESSKVFLF